MFRLLKKLLSFIWKQRKLFILFFALTFLFFFLRFPWSHLLEKTVKDFQKEFPSSFQTDFDRIQLKFFPPGVEFDNLFFNYKGRGLFLKSFRISTALSQWLAFKRAWRIEVVQENLSLSVVFWKKEKTLGEEPSESPIVIYFIKGYSPFLDLKVLNDLFPNMKMSGRIQTRFDYEGHLERIQEATAFFNLEGENIHLSKTEISTPLGPLGFPPIRWGKVEVVSHLKEGEVVFKIFRLGSPSDDFIIQMKGSGSVFFSYGTIRLNSYNIQLQIDVNKDFKMNILDLIFAGYKEDKGGFYRYSLRMTGQGNQVPHMEKLSEQIFSRKTNKK